MTAYADFEYYQNTYHGMAIEIGDFPRLAMRSSAILDALTFGRALDVVIADTDTATIDKIRQATCGIAEVLKWTDRTETDGGGVIASEQVGSHSVSYVQTPDMNSRNEQKWLQVAKVYLWDTGLLYAGV